MWLTSKLEERRLYRLGVRHCTFDPNGPGVVRIHLVPPKPRFFGASKYIVILNGYYILPLGYSWALLLAKFMDEVNATAGEPVDDVTLAAMRERTARYMLRTYPATKKEYVLSDLDTLLDILFTVARGGAPKMEVGKLNIRDYAPNMTAPHRMDLMVRAMTDAEGCWACNQKCAFCYAAGEPLGKSTELSTEEWKSILEKLRRAGVPMVTFTGGEPTLRPDLVELVDAAKWFVTRLNTNGVALTEELVARLREASLDNAQITFYSSDKTVHNTLVGCDHYDDTVAGIRNAVAGGLDVSVNTPLCRLNRDYPATLAFLHSLGVRYVTVSGLILTGSAAKNHENYDLSTEELTEIVRAAKAFCDEHGMEMDFTSPGLIPHDVLETLGLNVPACGAALSNMAISPDGTVIPCQSYLSADGALGNLLSTPFSEIWDAPLCRELRAMDKETAECCPFREKKKQEDSRDV